MVSFETSRLSEVADFASGKSIKPGGTGRYPVFGSNGVIGRTDGPIHGDAIVIGRVGAYCGSIALAEGDFWASDNTIVCSPKEQPADLRFLYYVLSVMSLNRFAGGSAQPLLTQKVLTPLEVPWPKAEIRHAVARLMSAFDDLIENNRRRIEILEAMARLVYREWFVHFRFPGHKNVELVDSDLGPIPEGWAVAAFTELAHFVNGFAFKPNDHWMDDGLPIIKIKELKSGVTRDTPRYHGEDIPKKYFIDNGDLLFSWSADLDAYVWPGGPALLNQHLFVVRPRDVSSIFLFQSLRGRMDEFRSRSQGTTMKHIKRSALSEVLTVVPDRVTREAFEESVGPMLELQLNLIRQNGVLREARDLLLPRLISGELDVSDLDLDLEPVA